MPSAHASCVYVATSCAACAPRRARRSVSPVQAPERGRERGGVARRDDEAVALVADQAAGDRAHGGGGDHGSVLVEGFVHDKAPRLQEVAGGDGRHYDNVAARVEVADFGRRLRACGQHRAGGEGRGSEPPFADQNQRGLGIL